MEVREEFGKVVLMELLKKTRSRRARVGELRRFDQVKRWSSRGSSRSAREFIVSLK